MSRTLRYAALVSTAELVPVPLLDTWVQNRLRRRLVRGEARRTGRELPEEEVRALADERVLSPMRLVTWPVRRVLRKVLLPLTLARTAVDTVQLAQRVSSAS